MESGLRDENDDFSLDKVVEVIEIIEPYIGKGYEVVKEPLKYESGVLDSGITPWHRQDMFGNWV
jgi:hypothetical protein